MRAYSTGDYSTIAHWCALRDISPPDSWMIPETGYIVDDVAAGFLLIMNNNVGKLEFFISNPNSDKKERDEALDEITTELIETARDVGIKLLTAATQNEAIKKRALFHDFQYQGEFSVFRLEL